MLISHRSIFFFKNRIFWLFHKIFIQVNNGYNFFCILATIGLYTGSNGIFQRALILEPPTGTDAQYIYFYRFEIVIQILDMILRKKFKAKQKMFHSFIPSPLTWKTTLHDMHQWWDWSPGQDSNLKSWDPGCEYFLT